MGAVAVIAGVFAQEVASELMVEALFSLNIRKAASVIVIYVVRASSVSEGVNWRIRTIQPKWAIEE